MGGFCTRHGAHVEIEDNWGNLVLNYYHVGPGELDPGYQAWQQVTVC